MTTAARTCRFAAIIPLICVLISVGDTYVIRSRMPSTPSKWANNNEIRLLREYLRIPTVHPDIDYRPAVAFLKEQAASLDLPCSVYYPVDDENPIVVITWEGSQPDLPSIMLNSHIDVVPVFEEYWTHPPFEAEMEENGDIFARGAQDTKNNGMQHLAAVRELKRQGIDRLKRTVYIVLVADEEIGGMRGMAGFVESDEFKAMNLGFVLGEGGGLSEESPELPAYYAERTAWQTEFTFHGHSGHGSKLFDDTPGEKLNYVLGKLTEYRKEEKRKLDELKYPYGNVTTINLTMLKGGVANNVIPAEMSALFDIRISVNTDVDEFNRQLEQWCEEAGGNITMRAIIKTEKEKVTPIGESNPYWVAFEEGITEAGVKIQPTVLAAGTDLRFVRRMNVPAIGFSPLLNTIARQHDHNEYINADVYLAGIDVFVKIIRKLGDLEF